mgnify:FL=1
MVKPNFKRAKEEAYKTLMLQENFSFPINPKNIKLKEYDVKIISFQEYAQKTNLSINQLTSNGNTNDGYTYIRNNNILIFYNEDIETEGRKMWTISHELGHIVLKHTTQCDKNESEANFFASQLLAPQCVLKQLIKNGAKITPTYLSEKFRISKEASENCIHILGKVIDNEFITTDYDDIIIQLFTPYVSIDYSLNSYLDELENRRKDFYF